MPVSLINHNTFKLPAKANKVIEIDSIIKLAQQLKNDPESNKLLLGQGSNVLFVEDFNGTVLLNKIKGFKYTQDEQYHYLHVAGGEIWHDLVVYTLSQEIYGLENLALIPGNVGSAPIQNIGAYGSEFSLFCDYVDLLEIATNNVIRLPTKDCKFGYRESVFKNEYKQGYVIIAVGLKLAKQWQANLSYFPLSKLEAKQTNAQQIFALVCATRKAKLPDPKEFGNAGSFFKNPVINNQQLQQLLINHPNLVYYPQANGEAKLAAGWLIDQAGLKGKKIGGAMVHKDQALVLVNQDQATSKDVMELANFVRNSVLEMFKVNLQPEVRFIAANGEVDSAEYLNSLN